MISGIKFLILSFLTIIGIKNFNQEMLGDILKNPFGYITSLFAGLFTATKLVVTPPSFDLAGELLKSFIGIFTAIIIAVLVFITNKIMYPIWEQKLKIRIHKFLGLK